MKRKALYTFAQEARTNQLWKLELLFCPRLFPLRWTKILNITGVDRGTPTLAFAYQYLIVYGGYLVICGAFVFCRSTRYSCHHFRCFCDSMQSTFISRTRPTYPGPRGFHLFFTAKFCDANRFYYFCYRYEAVRALKASGRDRWDLIFMPSAFDRRFWLEDIFNCSTSDMIGSVNKL